MPTMRPKANTALAASAGGSGTHRISLALTLATVVCICLDSATTRAASLRPIAQGGVQLAPGFVESWVSNQGDPKVLAVAVAEEEGVADGGRGGEGWAGRGSDGEGATNQRLEAEVKRGEASLRILR